MIRAVVGFGANLGDRLATLRAALARLADVARVEATSRVFESAPVGPPQPDYLNAAALVSFDGDAEALLDALLAIEAQLGRERRERWGPRTIDLDVLWIEGAAVGTARLAVPHPHLEERAFAVAPLLDVAPGAKDPRDGHAYRVPPGELRVVEPRL